MAEIIQFPGVISSQAMRARKRLDTLIDILHEAHINHSEAWAHLAETFVDYQQAFLAYAFLVGEDAVEEVYWELFNGENSPSQEPFQWDFEHVYDW